MSDVPYPTFQSVECEWHTVWDSPDHGRLPIAARSSDDSGDGPSPHGWPLSWYENALLGRTHGATTANVGWLYSVLR